jgi:hypothetical protein
MLDEAVAAWLGDADLTLLYPELAPGEVAVSAVPFRSIGSHKPDYRALTAGCTLRPRCPGRSDGATFCTAERATRRSPGGRPSTG